MNILKSVQKNLPEFKAFFTGKMPSFVYGKTKYSDIPVFCFHEANHVELEECFKFLTENNYRTLTADEYYDKSCNQAYVNDGKDVLLTFDDGLASVWSVGFPLFKKYNITIVLFVLPSLTREGNALRALISTKEEIVELQDNKYNNDYNEPLCTWLELIEMHKSGYVDIQSHGMKHSLISISPKIIDFIHPDFDANTYGNVHIPEYANKSGDLTRDKCLGDPVYESKPRLSGVRRYKDNYLVRKKCRNFISSCKDNFFELNGWRNKLFQQCAMSDDAGNEYETTEESYQEMLYELKQSKIAIESNLPGKKVSHFCFPWFIASYKSARIAKEVGYKSIYLGVIPGFGFKDKNDIPLIVTRLQKEYLLSLPGVGRKNLIKVMLSKLHKNNVAV